MNAAATAMPYVFQPVNKAEFAGDWALVQVTGSCPAAIDGCGGCDRNKPGHHSFCELSLCTESQTLDLPPCHVVYLY
jgi:hypothetical protein